MPSAIPCSLSLYSPLISTLLFSRTGGVVSHLNSLTHRLLRFPLKNLCSVFTLIVSSLVFAATDTAYCQALFSLELAESRILHAAPAAIHPRTPSFHSALSSYAILGPLALWQLSVSGLGPGELPIFWGSMVFRHAPIPLEGVRQQQQRATTKEIQNRKLS